MTLLEDAAGLGCLKRQNATAALPSQTISGAIGAHCGVLYIYPYTYCVLLGNNSSKEALRRWVWQTLAVTATDCIESFDI